MKFYKKMKKKSQNTRINNKQPPKQTKPTDQDDFKGKLLEMFGFDIDSNFTKHIFTTTSLRCYG